MRYAILNKNADENGYFSIRRTIITKKPIENLNDLSITVDFELNELIEIGDSVQSTDVYDATNQTFISPVVRDSMISKHALFQRLTLNEKMMLIAPDDIEQIPSEAKILLKVFAKEIEIAQQIDLDLAMFVEGLEQLEAFGLIEAGRANEIRGING